MLGRRSVAALAALILIVCAGAMSPARAEMHVDLELVLAVDVSLSMDLEEQRLQRDGYVAAFRDPRIWQAIASGQLGRIAVTYFEWAGIATQATIIPWRVIDGAAAAEAFAAELEAKPISRARMTSISGALQHALRELEQNALRGSRRVIDVSGDGPNNSGPPIEPVRDLVVARGIVINGLPIQLKVGGPNSLFDMADLDRYYVDCVIGGPGAFSIPIRERSEFATATRQKLILEISGVMPARPPRLLQAATTDVSDGVDCLIGEKMWRRYQQGGDR
jgi:hypothetical protein